MVTRDATGLQIGYRSERDVASVAEQVYVLRFCYVSNHTLKTRTVPACTIRSEFPQSINRIEPNSNLNLKNETRFPSLELV